MRGGTVAGNVSGTRQNVDEKPYSTLDYNEAASGIDTYAFSNLTIVDASAVVNGVQVSNYASKTDVAAFYVVIAVLTFWLSFGPKAGLYTLFYEIVPAFSFLRAPARFG